MKLVTYLVLLYFSMYFCSCNRFLTNKKIDNDLEHLKKQTLEIMGRLNIPFRKNYIKDDNLSIIVYESNYLTANFGQERIFPYSNITKTIDTINRFYKKPNIAISSRLNKIYLKKSDTTFNIRINALGTFIHEFVHYFQVAFSDTDTYIEGKDVDMNEHVSQKVEFEAYLVESYFNLYYLRRRRLKEIYNLTNVDNERNKQIINEYFSFSYPNLNIKF